MKKLLSGLLLVLVAASLLVSGCGKQAGEQGDAGKNAAPAKEKVLVWGRSGDSVGLDPANETDGESFYVTEQIFETPKMRTLK